MAEQLRGPFENFVDSPYYSVYVFEKWVEHRLPRDVLPKGDRHRTSTKFRLEVKKRIHELFKRPSYYYWRTQENLQFFSHESYGSDIHVGGRLMIIASVANWTGYLQPARHTTCCLSQLIQ